MVINDFRPPGPKLKKLIESEERPAEGAEEGVVECPFSKKPRLKPLRVMAWHIDELGGGLYRPSRRARAAIDSYAAIISKLELDICVLMGLRQDIGHIPKAHKDDDISYLVMDDTPEDSGKAEVDRILDALNRKASGGTWKAQYPSAETSGEILYVEQATTCFLYRSSTGIEFSEIELLESDIDPDLGLSGVLVSANFTAPEHREEGLTVIAPLGRAPATGPPRRSPSDAFHAILKKPETSLVVLSSPTNLKASSKLSRFKADWGAIYRPPRNEGSVLKSGFWEQTVEQNQDLLVNFFSLNPGDVCLQDEQMHWNALHPPDHAELLEEVDGILRDTILVCDRSGAGGPKSIDELRIVDLIRSMLTTGQIEQLATESNTEESCPELPCEDTILAEFFKTERKQNLHPASSNPANDLGEARFFSAELSSHWPVVLQLEFRRD